MWNLKICLNFSHNKIHVQFGNMDWFILFVYQFFMPSYFSPFLSIHIQIIFAKYFTALLTAVVFFYQTLQMVHQLVPSSQYTTTLTWPCSAHGKEVIHQLLSNGVHMWLVRVNRVSPMLFRFSQVWILLTILYSPAMAHMWHSTWLRPAAPGRVSMGYTRFCLFA